MINIEFVNLTANEFSLPSRRVGMVFAQPYLPNESLTDDEPFQLTENATLQHLNVLKETLSIARSSGTDNSRTHFTVLPEYSIPGLEGVQLINDELHSADWPNGTVLIGGIDGLSRDQYEELVLDDSTNVSEQNSPSCIDRSRWINCAIIWIKLLDGRLERWIQPKLSPAWEQANTPHIRMYEGCSIHVFKGRFENGGHFLFCTLVCFDWIACIEDRNVFEWLLKGVHDQAGDGQLPLNWIFVIQRNKKPSHQNFLDTIQRFFDCRKFPNAKSDNTCLVFVNTAGKSVPGQSKDFGSSSMVFSQSVPFVDPCCQPTFSKGGPKFRNGNDTLRVHRCNDVFFREGGACIHSIVQNVPELVGSGPSNRSIALKDAKVFPISGKVEARAPKEAVPAVTKWLHDELDRVDDLHPPCRPIIKREVEKAHELTVTDFRKLSSTESEQKMKLASSSITGCADDWAETASDGLRHLVKTLSVLRMACNATIVSARSSHAKAVLAGRQVDIVAVRGETHGDCEKHLRAQAAGNSSRHLLLISRDKENTLRPRRDGSILHWGTTSLDGDPKITEPSQLVMSYQDLWTVVQDADEVGDIANGIHDHLAT